MTPTRSRPLPDYTLVARAEACLTGANAHDLHVLLGNYQVLCHLARGDEALLGRVGDYEQRILIFCHREQQIEAPRHLDH